MKKFGALILVVVILAVFLASCASSDELIGTWGCNYTYNGNAFYSSFTLEEDGTWTGIVFKNGSLSSTKEGHYKVEGNKVLLYENGEVSYSIYTYSVGKLENGGRTFEKVSK